MEETVIKIATGAGIITGFLLFGLVTTLFNQYMLLLVKKLLARQPRHRVMWEHSRRQMHRQDDHQAPLYRCLDGDCDTIFIDLPAIEEQGSAAR